MSNAIHFLNTGAGDCIILESNGCFGMIDCAEDNEYPLDKPHLKAKGYEDEILKYLFAHCADESGMVNLDFVLGTHAHSDHIGGFDTIISHPKVRVGKAFLRPYDDKKTFVYERVRWDNDIVYEQMKNALNAKNVEIIESFEKKQISLGEFNLTFINAGDRRHIFKYGENVSSVGVVLEHNGFRAFFAGDMNNKALDETRYAKYIGRVDLLKVGHHGYPYSTSLYLLKKLKPEYAVICNSSQKAYPSVKYRLEKIAGARCYYTVDSNGVKVVLDNGVKFIESIM